MGKGVSAALFMVGTTKDVTLEPYGWVALSFYKVP